MTATKSGIKGFAITPVVLGRIGIGEMVEQNNKRLPRKLDHMVITGLSQLSGGIWSEHPEMTKLIEAERAANPDKYKSDTAKVKLHSIPVRIMFDSPENNFKAEYTCFDDKGRPLCAGNGDKAKRRDSVSEAGVKEVPCPGADLCEFGQKSRCKQFGRLIIGMESLFESDPLSGFMFRTTSFNSIRALTARLKYFAALTCNKMAGMPCTLRMRAKSTAASFRQPIFYLDLEPAGGIIEAANKATAWRKKMAEAGMSYDALDLAVKEGIEQSAFFESAEDGEEVREEFIETSAMDDDEHATAIQLSADGHDKPAAIGSSAVGAGDSDAAAVSTAKSSVGPHIHDEERCLPSQIKQIDALLDDAGQDARAELFAALSKPVETQVASLTLAEAAQAIQLLMQKTKQSRRNPSASIEKPAVAPAAAAAPVVDPHVVAQAVTTAALKTKITRTNSF